MVASTHVARKRRTSRTHRKPEGIRVDHIEGRYRPITVHQIALAWWLYAEGHITKRQLRVYFAAHELDERRRYTDTEDLRGRPGKSRERSPRFTLLEIARLVGGLTDSPTGGGNEGSGGAKTLPVKAQSELRTDLRALKRIGLVAVSASSIRFASSADAVRVDDLSGFWSMLEAMANPRRTVPVPRRMLRALAGGFSKAVTAVIIAVLIRGLFWHKDAGSGGKRAQGNSGGDRSSDGTRTRSGDYRTDGRYKLSWVSDHFGISRRAATDARGRLIELGWIEPLDVDQWEMNKWGLRDRIVTDWAPPTEDSAEPCRAVGKKRAVGGSDTQLASATTVQDRPRVDQNPSARSATRTPDSSARSASPDQTDPLSLTGEQNTRSLTTPGERAGERSGVFTDSTGEKTADQESGMGSRRGQTGLGVGSRRASDARARRSVRWGRAKPVQGPPNIRDIRAEDLRDTDRLLELHRQAAELGLVSASESGRLDFLSLAERARARGKRAGALFYWLLRERKYSFITQADEEEAASRLREHLNGRRPKPTGTAHVAGWRQAESSGGGEHAIKPADPLAEMSSDHRFVVACIRVAKQSRGMEPFDIARARGWTRQRFEAISAEVDVLDTRRWARRAENAEFGV